MCKSEQIFNFFYPIFLYESKINKFKKSDWVAPANLRRERKQVDFAS